MDRLGIGVPPMLRVQCGRTFHAALVAAMAYWLGLTVVAVRRPSCPTAVDVFLVKYGFLFVLPIVLTVGPMVWDALGRW